jgi:hypothetical protein
MRLSDLSALSMALKFSLAASSTYIKKHEYYFRKFRYKNVVIYFGGTNSLKTF